MTDRRLGARARMLAITAAAVLASALTLTVGSTGHAADAAPATAPLGFVTGYAIPQPDCGNPAPGHAACLSFRLRWVSKGTPGARAIRVPAVSSGPARLPGLSPSQLATAYGYTPSSAVGASQTVALIDAYDDPKALAELDAFDKYYGLPRETAKSFRKVNQAGKAAPLPAEDDGWSGEIALDIEAVRAVCHKCHILLVEADSDGDSDLAHGVDAAAKLGATEISNSYGSAELLGGQLSSRATIAAYNHPKIVITASTGDDGWDDWDLANSPSGSSNTGPEVPAAYPTVVGVGGTTLNHATSGSRSSETVWNGNGPDDSKGLSLGAGSKVTWHGPRGASGGGCSSLYRAQSFKTATPGYPCAHGLRSAVDIAADADPNTGFNVYDSISFGGNHWGTVGGTSLASPLIAAMWALAGGSGGVAYPAQNLYQHLNVAPSTLYDVTSGGNSFCGGDSASNCSTHLDSELPQSGGDPNSIVRGGGWAGYLDCGTFPPVTTGAVKAPECNAGTAFDGPSGVGTPHGLDAFKRTGPALVMRWPALVKRNVTTTYRATFSDSVPGSTAASYTWRWGDGTTTTSTTSSTTHRFAKAGTFAISVRVVDSAGRASTVAKKYVVGQAPVVKISGPTSVPRNKNRKYTAKVSDPNTGGKIVSYTWRSGSHVIGRSASVSHHFTASGTDKLTLTVVDNSGLSKRSNVVTVHVM